MNLRNWAGAVLVVALAGCSPMATSGSSNSGTGVGPQPFGRNDKWLLTATRAEKMDVYRFGFYISDSQPRDTTYWRAEFKTDRPEFSSSSVDGTILYTLSGGMTYLFTLVNQSSEEFIYCGFLDIKSTDQILKGVTYIAKNRADIDNVNPAFYFSLIRNDRTRYPVGTYEIQKQK